MPRLTKYRDEWLDLTDNNGNKIHLWCMMGKDEYHSYCKFCKKDIAIGNSGKLQLLQHANTRKHKSMIKDVCDTSQSKFKKIVTSSGDKGVCLERQGGSIDGNRNNSEPCVWSLTEDERIIRSEILWILHLSVNNYTFSSCTGIIDLFSKMFPGSIEAKSMKLSPRKISYEISHGLGPYFLNNIVMDINKNRPFYTIMYDESLNEANKKQLDIHIRFWSDRSSGILEHYLGCELLCHATAVDIDKALMSVICSCKFDLKRMLMLGSDGPNVNKAVFKIMNKRLLEMESAGLINIGTCNLHIVHNAFGEGLKLKAFSLIVEFLEDVDIWFRKYPSRFEDLQESFRNADIEDNMLNVLRHVSNRWLSIVPVCKRILHLYPGLSQHFIVDLVKNKSALLKSDRYQRIKKMFASPLTLAYLHFVISVGTIFENFLRFLQSEKTLIHVLYDEMSSLVRNFLSRFINMDDYQEKKVEEFLDIPLKDIMEKENLKYLDVGSEAENVLSHIEKSENRCFKLDAGNFFLKVTLYLLEKLPLKNKLLQSLQVLHPLVRKEPASITVSTLKRLSKLLPQCVPISKLDNLVDEWRIYISDSEILDEWSHEQVDKNGITTVSWKQIDVYWGHVFSIVDRNTLSTKYPYLAALVKASLCLSHGQASVERGFSVNKRMLTCDRSTMKQSTIVGLRLIKDGVKVKGNITEIDITREMIGYYKDASAKYKADLRASRLFVEKEQNESKKTGHMEENSDGKKQSTKDMLNNLKGDMSSAQKLLEEGNKRLNSALKRKSFDEVVAAQALIEAGTKKLKQAQ